MRDSNKLLQNKEGIERHEKGKAIEASCVKVSKVLELYSLYTAMVIDY